MNPSVKNTDKYILIRTQLRKEVDNINKIIEFYDSLLVDARNSYFEIDRLIGETEK